MIENVLGHKKEIDRDLLRLSKQWLVQWQRDYSDSSEAVLESLTDLLNRGGKRVRGALAMESYYLHGGTRPEVALGAARVIELVQAYLLIMDDIADNSMMRRGGLAVHAQLAKSHEDQSLKGDSIHYGLSQATNAAMLAIHRAMGELVKLPASDAAKIRATELLNQDVSITIVGQINDIYNEVARKHIKPDEIINTLTWKTAYYTFVSPLELGACLAGADGLNSRLREYALKAGVAFQINDDILGTFGDSFEVGKSADDDIREGKATLLVSHARKHASPEQLVAIDGILGQPGATAADCDRVRAIFVETGAKDYAEEIAARYATEAIVKLGNSPESFLVTLAQFAVKRTS